MFGSGGGGAPAPAQAPSTGGTPFSFSSSQPATSNPGGFSFGSSASAAPASSSASPTPATSSFGTFAAAPAAGPPPATGFSFGVSATPAPATTSSSKTPAFGSFGAGTAPAAAAPATGFGFAGFGTSSGGFSLTEKTASAGAPAPAFGLSGSTNRSSFGGGSFGFASTAAPAGSGTSLFGGGNSSRIGGGTGAETPTASPAPVTPGFAFGVKTSGSPSKRSSRSSVIPGFGAGLGSPNALANTLASFGSSNTTTSFGSSTGSGGFAGVGTASTATPISFGSFAASPAVVPGSAPSTGFSFGTGSTAFTSSAAPVGPAPGATLSFATPQTSTSSFTPAPAAFFAPTAAAAAPTAAPPNVVPAPINFSTPAPPAFGVQGGEASGGLRFGFGAAPATGTTTAASTSTSAFSFGDAASGSTIAPSGSSAPTSSATILNSPPASFAGVPAAASGTGTGTGTGAGGFSFGTSVAKTTAPIFSAPAGAPAAFAALPSAGTFSFGTTVASAPTTTTSALTNSSNAGAASAVPAVPAPSATPVAAPATFSFGTSAASAPAPDAPIAGGGFVFGTSVTTAPTVATTASSDSAAPASTAPAADPTSAKLSFFGVSAAPVATPASTTSAPVPATAFSFGKPASTAAVVAADAPAPSNAPYPSNTPDLSNAPGPSNAPDPSNAPPVVVPDSDQAPATLFSEAEAVGATTPATSSAAPIAATSFTFGAPPGSPSSKTPAAPAASPPAPAVVSAPTAGPSVDDAGSNRLGFSFGPTPTAPVPDSAGPVAATVAASAENQDSGTGTPTSPTKTTGPDTGTAAGGGFKFGTATPVDPTASSSGGADGVSTPASADASSAAATAAPAPAGGTSAFSFGSSSATGSGLPSLGLSLAPVPEASTAVAPSAFTPASAGDPDAVDPTSDEFWRNADDGQVFSLLRAPDSETPRLAKLALMQGSAGKRLRDGLLDYYKQPSAESLKKVLDGKVALAEGKREEALPGGKDEGSFCISLSKLLSLDEVQCVQVLHAYFRRKNSERPRESTQRASEGFDFSSQDNLFKVRDYHRDERFAQLLVLRELLLIDQAPGHSLEESASGVFGWMPNLVRTLLDLTRDLFETNPPAAELAMGSGPSGDWRGGLGGAAAAVISARKSEWVAHKVAELAELARCMVLAGYIRYPMAQDQADLAVDILCFIQEADFSMPPSFRAYIPAGSEVSKKSRIFSFMMALVGVHALDLQSVDYPKVLQEYHPLFKDFNSEDAAVRKAARARLGLVDETLASMLDGLKSERAATRCRSMAAGSKGGSSEDVDMPQTLLVIAWGSLLRSASAAIPGFNQGWGEDAGRGAMIFANRESSIDHLAEFGRGLMETCEDAPLQGAGLWGAEAARFSALCIPPALRLGPSPRRATPPTPQEVVLAPSAPPDSAVFADTFLLGVYCFMKAVQVAPPIPQPQAPDSLPQLTEISKEGVLASNVARRGFGPEHLEEVGALSRLLANVLRGQSRLSWRELMMALKDVSISGCATRLLLNAARSLFPISIGSYARLLSSLVHSQVTANIVHAVLAGLDDANEESGDVDAASSKKRDVENQYIAILDARGSPRDRVWKRESGNLRDDNEAAVFTGDRVVISRSFGVPDTGMTVTAGTRCEVVRGNKEEGAIETTIYVRFKHPEPPWSVMVGKLNGMARELQGLGGPFSEASALSVAKRLAETEAVVELMNTMFRHSLLGPMRVEAVLRSFKAQSWLIAEGLPNLAVLLKQSRCSLEGELRIGRCYTIPAAKAELEGAGGAEALIASFAATGDPLPLNNDTDCFAAQLPRLLVQMLRGLLPLVTSLPPTPSTFSSHRQTPSKMRKSFGRGGVGAGGVTGPQATLRSSLYDLATAVVDLLGTLAAHGVAAEIQGVRLDDGVAGGVDTGGNRWVREIAIEFGGAHGAGDWLGGGWSGGRGGGANVLEACWGISRNVDGVQGTYAFTRAVLRLIRSVLQHLGQAHLPTRGSKRFGVTNERCLYEAGSRMTGFVTLALPSLQDWAFRGMGQRWALSLLCLQSLRVLLDQPLPSVTAALTTTMSTESGTTFPFPVARALRADASRAVAQDLSVGTAVAACMGLLVAAAVATERAGNKNGRRNGSGSSPFSSVSQDLAPELLQSLLPVDFSEAFSGLRDDDGDSPLDILTALAQEALVVLERVLVENARLSGAVSAVAAASAVGPASDGLREVNRQSQAAAAAVSGVSHLLLRPAEGKGFVSGWPFGDGDPDIEVPSFALLAAALSSFPSRALSPVDLGMLQSLDLCAIRLPALANATLASLVRCDIPHNSGGLSGGLGTPAAAGATSFENMSLPLPTPGTEDPWSATQQPGPPAEQQQLVRPLADSLGPGDGYHWRRALMEAMSAPDSPSSATDGREEGMLGTEERRNAALDLLLSALSKQPALVVVLFWSRPPGKRRPAAATVARAGASDEAGSEAPLLWGPEAVAETVLSLLRALALKSKEGHLILAGGTEALVKALELVLALWNSEGVGRLGQAVFELAASEEFWRLVTSVLIQDLTWDTRSRHAAAVGDRDWTGRPSQGGGERGLTGPQTAHLCNTLRCHAIVFEILSLEMHRGLRPLGAGALQQEVNGGKGENTVLDGAGLGGDTKKSKVAAKAVEGFIKKNIETYFGCWTSTFTLFSLDPRLAEKAKKLAADVGLDLDGDLAVPADERIVGDGFLYHIPCLERILGLAPHDRRPTSDAVKRSETEERQSKGADGEGQLALVRSSSSGEDGGVSSGVASNEAALRLACEATNRNWSLAEAEADILRAFRTFVEVCILRRQPGYERGHPLKSTQSPGTPRRGDGGGTDSGEVSPARSPLVAIRFSGGGPGASNGGARGFGAAAGAGSVVASEGSDFLGDKRSFSMVRTTAQRLAGEKRKGWAVVRVISEMCDALVSMLHHQLHEVVQKALDPGRSIVRRRDPTHGRLIRRARGQMVAYSCDQTLGTLAPALEELFYVAPLSRILEVGEETGDLSDANAISRVTAISLCLRVRLRLLMAGLLLLRASGGTAEDAVVSAASAREGGEGMKDRGAGRLSFAEGASCEGSLTASDLARLKLLRRACGTLAELDALEEAGRGGGRGAGTKDHRRRSYSHREAKRGPGVSLLGDGVLEVEGDRALCAHLACVCVSIMQEMTVPRSYLRRNASKDDEQGNGERKHESSAFGMEVEVERIVREEKVQVIPRLLRHSRKASRLACASFPALHSTPIPPTTSASERYRDSRSGGSLDMDIDDPVAKVVRGSNKDSRGSVAEEGIAEAEGAQLLQLIYGFFASSAARGLFTSAMLQAGVLGAMIDDPLFVLLRQASANTQPCVPRGYNSRSELSVHWRCYLLAMRTTSDLAGSFHDAKMPPNRSSTLSRQPQPVPARYPSVRGISSEDAEAGLETVFQFVEAFRGIMVEGLSTLPPSPAMRTPAAGRGSSVFGGGDGGGRPGTRLTLALLQERLDIVGLVGALGPCIPRWRAQHPDTSVALLEAVRQATRTAAVLLVPSTGPPPPKAATEGSSGGAAGARGSNGQTSNLSGEGGGWSSPPQQNESTVESTSMQKATPTSATEAGLTPSRLGRVIGLRNGSGGGAGGAGDAGGGAGDRAGGVASGGGAATGADSRPPELIKSCFLAITHTEKNYLESSSSGEGQGSSDAANDYGGPCAMAMATPTPVRGGAVVGGGVAATGGGARGSGAEGAQQGFCSRVEDGLTFFLVLALGILRRVSPQPKDMRIEVSPEDRGSIEVSPEDRGSIEAPVGANIECRLERRTGDANNRDHSSHEAENGAGKPREAVRLGTVMGRDPRGRGYIARFEAISQPGFLCDELVPWEEVVAIRDPGAAIPIFAYQALHSLPHHHHHPQLGLHQGGGGGAIKGRSKTGIGGGAGNTFSEELSGMMFEGLYHEPSLGHLVGLVRHYIHRMEVVSKEEDPAIELGGVVSNDEVNARRWRLSQLGYVAESSLWMLVVNALAHEGWAGEGSPAPSPVERQRLHDEIFDLFETRLEPFAPIWVILGHGEGGRAPISICPGFVAHMKSMVQVWLDQVKATKKEKDASTPKSKPQGGLGKRNGVRGGTIWSPVVGVGTQIARQQGSDMGMGVGSSRTSAINQAW